ncbi:hypothetical protein Tco_0029274 [Tanacetum coccineum]
MVSRITMVVSVPTRSLKWHVGRGWSVGEYLSLKDDGYVDTLECLGYPMPREPSVSLILNSLSKDYEQFVHIYNIHSMGKTIVELHAMLKLTEEGIPIKADTPVVLVIREAYAPKLKIPPPPKKENPEKDSICHHRKQVGH